MKNSTINLRPSLLHFLSFKKGNSFNSIYIHLTIITALCAGLIIQNNLNMKESTNSFQKTQDKEIYSIMSVQSYNPSIARIWHAWVKKENAEKLEDVLTDEVLPEFEKELPKGYQGIQILRRETEDEVEFTTIMWFDSIEAVKGFAGENYEKAHIDSRVKPLLLRYDQQSVHLEVKHSSYR